MDLEQQEPVDPTDDDPQDLYRIDLRYRDEQADCLAHAHRHGTDLAGVTDWVWPYFELEPSAGA